ncbi:MAG: hypothetical protein M5U01_10510 [Ardenticatenaceae bacterium]|nr:hypothetical protein [Ardenticatenaceae bacterium]HBY92541.1 hypothetical protein [Chloroflexota bacterium]
MATPIQPGAEVVATDGPLGRLITVVPLEDRPDEPAFLVVDRAAGVLLTIPADTIEALPSPTVVRLNVSVELAIELDRASRARAAGKAESMNLHLVEELRALQDEQLEEEEE